MKFWKGFGRSLAAAGRRGNPRAYGFQTWIVNALAGLVVGVSLSAGAATAQPRLLVLGDSLTAGYGLPAEQAFPVRLQDWLKRNGADVTVINAGVSGDTSAGGLARLEWAIGTAPPDFALIELGANDGLRGLPPTGMEANLDKIIARLKTRGAKVLLAGMYAPRNFGREYAAEFDAVFPRLAERHQVLLYPFFLDGAATDPTLNQPDGIHPNARGVEAIVERIGPHIRRLIAGG